MIKFFKGCLPQILLGPFLNSFCLMTYHLSYLTSQELLPQFQLIIIVINLLRWRNKHKFEEYEHLEASLILTDRGFVSAENGF